MATNPEDLTSPAELIEHGRGCLSRIEFIAAKLPRQPASRREQIAFDIRKDVARLRVVLERLEKNA